MPAKTTYYTDRHEALSKNVALVKAGKAFYKTPRDLLVASGYTPRSAAVTLSNPKRNKAIVSIIEDIWSLNDVSNDLKEITGEARRDGSFSAALKGIDMRLKMSGEYAPVKTEVEHKGTIEHEVTLGQTDYLEFKRDKIDAREVLEGQLA